MMKISAVKSGYTGREQKAIFSYIQNDSDCEKTLVTFLGKVTLILFIFLVNLRCLLGNGGGNGFTN